MYGQSFIAYWTLYQFNILFSYSYFATAIHLFILMLYLMYAERHGLNPVFAFSLAIYAIYGVGELYEWPIHVLTWTTLEKLGRGLLFFTPKFLGVVFYFKAIVKKGWKLNWIWVGLFTVIMVSGLGFVIGGELTAEYQYYRIAWYALFFYAYVETPRDLP